MFDEYDYEMPKLMNDYSMIGVNYGVTFSNMYFSPSKSNRGFVYAPNFISIMYTKHCKMFDVYPYFAVKFGVQMGNEGYTFKEDEETGNSDDVDGATWCSIRVFEVPMMAEGHIDADPFKFLIDLGVYGGWRMSIERSGPTLDETYTNSFRDYEYRADYGLLAGAGFAFVFDPVEIHFNCMLRWSWSSLYEPDYASQYYYRYAYPIDIMATVGLHFHLGKRYGKTNKQLRKEAYEAVYGASENNSRKNRR